MAFAGANETAPGAFQRLGLQSLQAPMPLDEPWQFRPGDNMTWADPAYDDRPWQQRVIPGRWPEGGFPRAGQMAWYRFTVQLDLHGDAVREDLPLLGVRTGLVMSAFELYAGGELIGRVGALPPDAKAEYDRARVFPIPHRAVGEDGRLVLALRVWGGSQTAVDHWYGGPYRGDFLFGRYADLMFGMILGEAPGMVMVVLFLGFGVYHLYLHSRNRQLQLYLWYGLMAINIGVYSFTLGQWKYLLGWPFVLYQKLEYGSIHLLPAVSIQMIWVMLRQPIGPVLRAYQLSFVALAALVCVFPGIEIHYYTLRLWHIWTVPLLLYTPWLLLREAGAGSREAKVMLPAVVVFVATCFHDIVLHYAGPQMMPLIPFGFAAIAVAMAISLADNLTTMLNTLEEEVARRTAALSEANMQLAEAARADPLTGLLNRRGFLEEAETEVNRFHRSGRPFTLVLGDVDHFKQFNDTYGHACGDYVLRRVADLIVERLRDVDRAGRWGGEEFILLLPETDTQGAAVLADKLRKIIEASTFQFEGKSISITMTFGVATFRKDENLDSCIARADTAMYHGKEAGRNKVMLGGYKGLTVVP